LIRQFWHNRAQIGAQYTDPEEINMIVEPVIFDRLTFSGSK
jgi:hypothetical protein